MARFLMCRPEHFTIRYEINPWMSLDRQPHKLKAQAQWAGLHGTLTGAVGAHVELVDPAPGLPDMCFTANAGYVCDDTVVPSQFRHAERAGEAPHFRRWFEEKGYRVLPLGVDVPFEGAGDALPCAGRIFAGYWYRSDIRAHAALGELLGVPVVSLQLTHPRFYHIDTCFCPVAPLVALYYPAAFDGYAVAALKAHIPELIPVSDEDAAAFGCNALCADGHVILNAPCRALSARLSSRGFEVHRVDLSEFLKAGGSAKCLTLRLDQGCTLVEA